MTKRVGIYCRISLDRSGEALGVDRQERLCRAIAKERGWTVEQVYVDNDVSAFSGKRRPQYEAMVNAVEQSDIQAIIAIDRDRLARRMGGLDDLLRLCERQRVPIVLHSGEIDTTTADGIFKAQILGAVAESETRKNSARVRRQREHAALAGRPGAGRRVFGYRPDRVAVDEKEAALVREAVQRFLAGESPRALAQDFNHRKIRTSAGNEWSKTAMRALLGNPRYAGLVERHGAIIEGVKAQWPSLITRKQHERSAAALKNGRRTQRGRPAINLLSGIARCAKCGARMHGSRTKDGRRYMCPSAPGRSGGCGRIAIAARPLEDTITEELFRLVDNAKLARAANKKKTKANVDDDDLGEIDARLADLADLFASGEITKGEWLRARAGLEERRERALRSLETDLGVTALRPYGRRGALRAAWQDMSIEQRRAVLMAVIDHIEIGPATKVGRGFDPERIVNIAFVA
jgi:DNA invertase Pin-like site-specific DNA recombinase